VRGTSARYILLAFLSSLKNLIFVLCTMATLLPVLLNRRVFTTKKTWNVKSWKVDTKMKLLRGKICIIFLLSLWSPHHNLWPLHSLCNPFSLPNLSSLPRNSLSNLLPSNPPSPLPLKFLLLP